MDGPTGSVGEGQEASWLPHYRQRFLNGSQWSARLCCLPSLCPFSHLGKSPRHSLPLQIVPGVQKPGEQLCFKSENREALSSEVIWENQPVSECPGNKTPGTHLNTHLLPPLPYENKVLLGFPRTTIDLIKQYGFDTRNHILLLTATNNA